MPSPLTPFVVPGLKPPEMTHGRDHLPQSILHTKRDVCLWEYRTKHGRQGKTLLVCVEIIVGCLRGCGKVQNPLWDIQEMDQRWAGDTSRGIRDEQVWEKRGQGTWISVHWSDWALLLTMNLIALRVQLRYEQLEGTGVWDPAAE